LATDAKERTALTADLMGAGMTLGWFPDTVEAWELWCIGAPIEVLRDKAGAVLARAETLDPSRKYAAMRKEAAAYLNQVMSAKNYPSERISKAEAWAEHATLREILAMVLKVKEGK
jgi:hypothetical protein